MYVPFPPRSPSGTSRPSPNAFLIAAVVLKPQYRAACAVVIGPSRKQIGSAAVDREAGVTPSARSSSRTASRISSRRYSSRVAFESRVPNVLSSPATRSNILAGCRHTSFAGSPGSTTIAWRRPLDPASPARTCFLLVLVRFKPIAPSVRHT